MSFSVTNTQNQPQKGEVPVKKTKRAGYRSGRKQQGFTMIELMIVVGLLAIIGTVGFNMFNGGVTNKATALQKWDLSNRLATVMTVVGQAGGGTTVEGNPFIVTNGSLLDVMVGGEDCVSTDFQRSYRSMGLRTFEESLEVTTAPVCDGTTATTPGVYKMGNSDVTVGGTNGELTLEFTNVTPDELEAIVSDYGDNKTYTVADSGTAATDGPLSWDAATGGLHTVTITRNLR